MKRLILFSLTLLISITLIACNSEETTTVLEAEQNGVTMKFTFIADGDRVVEQSADNIIPYESVGITTPEEAEQLFGAIAASYEETEGITYSMDYQDDQAVETFTVNYDEADLEEASELYGSSFEGDTSGDVSLERTIEMLEAEGFEIVE